MIKIINRRIRLQIKIYSRKENKIADTISRMHTICDKSTMHSNDIFYSKLHNTNFNNIMSDIIFLDNFLRENIDIFKYDCPLEYKVISNY